MTVTENQNAFMSAIRVIPPALRTRVYSACRDICDKVQEIVLRADRPVCIYIGSKQMCLTDRSTLSSNVQNVMPQCATKAEVAECFNNVCGYSVYSHLNEIKEGYITLPGGHRAGISGTAVVSNAQLINVRDISTVSLRISREVKGSSTAICRRFADSEGGLLICGSPSSGKTTVLRDAARLLSTDYAMRVSLVDTRGELAGTNMGVAGNDVGLCDVLDGYPRADGIEQAVRCLSPYAVICDEVGSESDARAIASGVNSGVRFIASMHASSKEELAESDRGKKLLSTKAFSDIVFLKGREAPGVISSTYSLGEILSD
ncbi:MAG: hypothetical protein ACI4GZ_05500 [Ruminococcus sp.]